MTDNAKTAVRRTTIAGAVIAAAGLVGAFAGLGFTAFWIAVFVGTPLSFLIEYLICRYLGIASHWDLLLLPDADARPYRDGAEPGDD